ncbi:hypothetical protein [Halalkalibacter krulwichiae]|nr:hypothetical protein [Halalkalibacter krulwichiae]
MNWSLCQPATENCLRVMTLFGGGMTMFYTPEQLHKRKKIKQVAYTVVLSTVGIALAVGVSVLVGGM